MSLALQVQPLPGLLVRALLERRGERLRLDQNLLKLYPPWIVPEQRDLEGIGKLALGLERRCCRGWDLEEGSELDSQDPYDQEGCQYPRPDLDQDDWLSSQS